MNILDKLHAMYTTFSITEKKVADYILSHPQEIPNMTIADLASQSEVSEASISRFCRKIEVVGFHALKIELAQVTIPKLDDHPEQSRLGQRIAHIQQNKIKEIEQTLMQLDEDVLQESLDQIVKAKRIIFLAYGNTIPVAMDAAYRFNQIGIASSAYEIWDTALASLLTFTTEDLVIVISNSGETKDLIKAIEWCRTQQLTVIAMTNNQQSPLAKLATIHLTTATRERLFQKDYYFSRVSAMLLTETLFLLLAFEEPERLEFIKRHEQLISDHKI